MTDLPRAAAARPLRLVAYGSSTTEGYGASDPTRTGYVARLRDALLDHLPHGLVVINRGVSGETIEATEARLADILSDRPDLVVWQTGSNDGPQGVSPSRFEATLRRGIAALTPTADLILMEPQWCPVLEAEPSFPPILRAVRAVAADLGVPLFPRYDLMHRWAADTGLGIDGLSPDGMHMDDTGYRLLGEAMAAFILQRV